MFQHRILQLSELLSRVFYTHIWGNRGINFHPMTFGLSDRGVQTLRPGRTDMHGCTVAACYSAGIELLMSESGFHIRSEISKLENKGHLAWGAGPWGGTNLRRQAASPSRGVCTVQPRAEDLATVQTGPASSRLAASSSPQPWGHLGWATGLGRPRAGGQGGS